MLDFVFWCHVFSQQMNFRINQKFNTLRVFSAKNQGRKVRAWWWWWFYAAEFSQDNLFIINPQPECFGHFGDRIPLLFTTIWGNSQPAGTGRYKLPRMIIQLTGVRCFGFYFGMYFDEISQYNCITPLRPRRFDHHGPSTPSLARGVGKKPFATWNFWPVALAL